LIEVKKDENKKSQSNQYSPIRPNSTSCPYHGQNNLSRKNSISLSDGKKSEYLKRKFISEDINEENKKNNISILLLSKKKD